MKKILSVLLIFAAIYIVLNAFVHQSRHDRAIELGTPSETWLTYVHAMENKDRDIVSKCILPSSRIYKLYLGNAFDDISVMYRTSNFTVISESNRGDYFVLQVKASLRPSGKEYIMSIPFINDNGKYLITDDEYVIKNSKMWESYEGRRIVFYYEKERFADVSEGAQNKDKIARYKFLGNDKKIFEILEKEFEYGSKYLNITINSKVDYYIVTSAIEFCMFTKYSVNDELPAGVAYPDKNKIVTYFSYNPHELAHILTSKIGNPPILLNETFTDYIESKMTWKYNKTLIDAKDCVARSGKHIGISHIFSNLALYMDNPVAKAELLLFYDYLINRYSIDKYKLLYSKISEDNYKGVFKDVYGKELERLEKETNN